MLPRRGRWAAPRSFAGSRASFAARSAARATTTEASCSSTRSRICWISSRSAAARSNSSCLAAAFISASIRATRRSTSALSAAASCWPRRSELYIDRVLGHGAQPVVDVVDALDDRGRARSRARGCTASWTARRRFVSSMATRIDSVTRSAYMTTSPPVLRAARPIIWISDQALRRNPSLSASRMATSVTSGRSRPSRRRLMPTRTSYTPRRRSRRIATRSSVSTSLWRYWTLMPSSLR